MNCNKKDPTSNQIMSNTNCFKLQNIQRILRNPKVFNPDQALENLRLITCGYTGVKAALLNYLYSVSELYDTLNTSVTISEIELKHIRDLYIDTISDLLSSISTSLSNRLTDCSTMVTYDLHWINDREEKDSHITDISHNGPKLKIEDLSILGYKNFDVAFGNSSITTYFARPGFQILADSSSWSVVLRISTNNQWTPVATDVYGRTGNTLHSRKNAREESDCKIFVIGPSMELREKGNDLDYNETLTGGGIDASGNPTDTSYHAFSSRKNAQLFFESILTPVMTNPSNDVFNINDNDILYLLGIIDKLIKQASLTTTSITTKKNVVKSICDHD